MRRALRILGYLAFTALTSFLLLEAALIALEPHLPLGDVEYDRELGFRMRPGRGDANRFGFNDWDYPLTPEPGVFRILVVGDSFSWAGGREGNYTAMLESFFERHFGSHRVDVINSGYPGTHTGEQLAMLRKYGLAYQPDLVLLGFFVGNDFVDADPNRKRIVVAGSFVDIDTRRELVLWGRPIVWRSRAWTMLSQWRLVSAELRAARAERAREEARYRADRPRGREAPDEQAPQFSEKRFVNIERGRLAFCRKQERRSDRSGRVEYIERSVAEMHDLLRERGIAFRVAIYPDEYQVDETLLQQVLDDEGLVRDDYDLRCQQRLLRRMLEAREIPFVDLTRTFVEKSAEGRRLYLPRNTHWNRDGNWLAARVLFRDLLPVVESALAARPVAR